MAPAADVVTCFLRHDGEVLLLRRADDASYPGRWGAVTGYVEGSDPVAAARREIREETAIGDPALVRAGEAFTVSDDALGRTWRVHPFLFEVGTREVRLDEEAAAAEWTTPTALLRRETAPEVWTAYRRVAPTPRTIAVDAERGSAALSIRALEVLRDRAGEVAVADGPFEDVVKTATALLAARPSMAAVRNRVHRAMAGAGAPAAVEEAAVDGIRRALDADARAAREAADAVAGARVLTLSRSGTVVDALLAAASTVVVAESQPGREGVGVAERLANAGLDVTLCADAAVAHVLAEEAIDAVLVGADAVLPDGRVVNKVGTRAAALAAAREGVAFYATAASDKVSTDAEPHLEAGDPAAVYDGSAPVAAVNPTFDVTPADCIDAVVTERGRLSTDDVAAIADEFRALATWRDDDR